LIVGITGAAIMWSISFFVLFASPVYGGIVAEAVLRSSGRKRGRIIEVIGVGSIIIGYILMLVLTYGNLFGAAATPGAAPAVPVAPVVAYGLTGTAWHLVGAALAISTCYGRLR